MKHTAVVSEIQKKIQIGELRRGVRLPSERALAEELGTSRNAVQAALRELESMGVVSRQTNCRPVVAAESFHTMGFGKPVANQIAVWMLPEAQDLGGAMMLAGIRSAFSERGYSLLLSSPSAYDPDSIRRAEMEFLLAAIDNPRAAGIITWDTGNPDCHPLYERIVKMGLPLVFVDRMPDMPTQADLVAANNQRAARLAIRYLYDLGHRSIAMVIGNEQASSVADRVDGYLSALREYGIRCSFDAPLKLDTRDTQRAASAGQIIDRLVHIADAPTAVFAVNDKIAYHLMEAAKRTGVLIPEQFSLIGFDWLARWIPSGGDLTTLAQPFEEIGRAAAQRVLDRAFRPTETPRHILFEVDIVVKDSTSRPFR